jgi:hypothetical protein
MTQDICPACGAFLILAEVQYFGVATGVGDDAGARLVYECPACHRVFERSMGSDSPILQMDARNLSLRARVAAWKRVTEV